jgi:23S rRNA (adenine2503-C2)-methyltransferase
VPALFGKNLAELTELMQGFGQKPYRARQVWEALYRQRVASVEDMTTLSQTLREQVLTAGWSVELPEIVQTARSVDGTERYLMRMADGETVETVWMPDGDGGERGDGSEAAEEEAAESVERPDIGTGAGMGARSRASVRSRRRDTGGRRSVSQARWDVR